MTNREYQDYIKRNTPKHNSALNLLRAFVAGGTVCVLGQLMTELLLRTGMEKQTASTWTLIGLIGLSNLLTGLNLFNRLAACFGAGVLVPITGFANAVAAPAIEYRRSEGFVYGVGSKIFSIAGPVILYGVLSSWVLGVIHLLWLQFGVG